MHQNTSLLDTRKKKLNALGRSLSLTGCTRTFSFFGCYDAGFIMCGEQVFLAKFFCHLTRHTTAGHHLANLTQIMTRELEASMTWGGSPGHGYDR